jgi:signal transduction histidine kinase
MEEKNNQNQNLDMQNSLAFFGAVTASVSHELNNVLAIMDQTTGLLDDRLAGGDDEIHIPAEKLDKIVKSLQHQAQRGLDLIKRLNRFAHSSDVPQLLFDVNQTLDNLVSLTNRLAGLKGARLEFHSAQGPLNVNSNPFILQQAVFAAILKVLQESRKDDVISIRLIKGDDRLEVEVEGPAPTDNRKSVDISDIKKPIELLSGDVKLETTGQRITLRLGVPN